MILYLIQEMFPLFMLFPLLAVQKHSIFIGEQVTKTLNTFFNTTYHFNRGLFSTSKSVGSNAHVAQMQAIFRLNMVFICDHHKTLTIISPLIIQHCWTSLIQCFIEINVNVVCMLISFRFYHFFLYLVNLT